MITHGMKNMKIIHMMLAVGFAQGAVSLGASVYPSETDTASPRHSRLCDTDTASIIRIDVTGDGSPDLLERWWNGKRLRWFDETGSMTWNCVWGDMVNGALQVDLDGDGFYDGPLDYNVKWADTDGDGIPDIQVFSKNPAPGSSSVFGKSRAVWYVTIDPENTGVLADIDWNNLSVNWTRWSTPGNWRPNYHGNASFIKEHAPIWAVENPEFSWENPFHFHDFDGDGCSDMSIRIADNRKFFGPGNNRLRFDGIVDEAWISFDIDNDAGKDNEADYDLTLYFGGGAGIDYTEDAHEYPQLRAPDWVLPYYRHPEWRQQTRFVYLRREGALERLLGADWGHAYLTFDEDDDCARWERVEIYQPGDPYILRRGGGRGESMISNRQSDSLGDRGEWDMDFSGKGRLYRAEWDGKLHLLGAEHGAWTVDRNREYCGAIHPNGKSSEKEAETVGEVVQYYDTNGNGFFDVITFDYNGDGVVDRTDNLLELGVGTEFPLLNVAELGWNGLRLENIKAVNRSWRHAQRFYRLAFRFGLVNDEAHRLAKATSAGEKYQSAYWLRETLVRKLLAEAPVATHSEILRAYYTHDMERMADVIAAGLPFVR